jgi:hypothetical protein
VWKEPAAGDTKQAVATHAKSSSTGSQ